MENRQVYHCEAYRYDEYKRKSIHRQIVSELEDYLYHLETFTHHWDEVEVRTPASFKRLLWSSGEGKLIAKIVNPRSKRIIIAKG